MFLCTRPIRMWTSGKCLTCIRISKSSMYRDIGPKLFSYNLGSNIFKFNFKIPPDTLKHDGNFIGTNFLWGGKVRVRVQVSRRELLTYINLDYIRVEILRKKSPSKSIKLPPFWFFSSFELGLNLALARSQNSLTAQDQLGFNEVMYYLYVGYMLKRGCHPCNLFRYRGIHITPGI